MGGSLLVAHQDVVEAFLLTTCIVEQRIIDRHNGTTGITENGFHTLGLQGSHERLRSCNSVSHSFFF